MLRASHFPSVAFPALRVLRLSLIPSLNLSYHSNNHGFFTFVSSHRLISNTFHPSSYWPSSFSFQQVPSLMGNPRPKGAASCSTGSGAEVGREILVQHLLVKEDDQKLLLDLQQRISGGEDLSDLAVEYSICPSKAEGGMLGWVRKGQMAALLKIMGESEHLSTVPEFEEAAFTAPINKVVRCKTKFGWHLLQVLSEREECLLLDIQPGELRVRMEDPNFMEDAQLVDVREPEEVARASLPGFKVLPLRQFGSWGPEITSKFDPEKDIYVMCHHGGRSLQVARWLLSQGFRKVYNLAGGIHAYAEVDPSVPTY